MKRRHRPSPQTLAVLRALAAKPECGAGADPGIADAAAGGAIAGVVP